MVLSHIHLAVQMRLYKDIGLIVQCHQKFDNIMIQFHHTSSFPIFPSSELYVVMRLFTYIVMHIDITHLKYNI